MIGVVAPSSVVPAHELALAVERLRAAGLEVRVHPQTRRRHRFFAGTDAERADAFLEFARDPAIRVIWCGRGGSGAIRTLDELRRRLGDGPKPPAGKLLVGYSDATVLMEFVRREWGWATLHGPMPGLREFSVLRAAHLDALVALVRGERPATMPSLARPLRWLTASPKAPIEGELVGGNLTVWASALGTPFEAEARGKLLFFEDVGEAPYRIDRQLSQLSLSGRLDGVRALVLGTFERCEDAVPSVLRRRPRGRTVERVLRSPKPAELRPLRPLLPKSRILRELFAELGERHGFAVAEGLPVGHGPEYPPLPLGGRYRLEPDGRLSLLEWSHWRAD